MTQDNSDDKPKTPKLISTAPPPITPLRGSGRTGTINTGRVTSLAAIDWQHWRIMKTVAAWEAVLLSFGTNPETAEIDWRDFNNYPNENQIKIIKRLRQLEGYLSDTTFFSHVSFGTNQRVHEFSLPEFAAWGLHVGFDDMPPELVAMAQKRNTPTVIAVNASDGIASNFSTDGWKSAARKIADECFDHDTEQRCRDNLFGYAKRVMEKMQERQINGPRGLIDNAKTIQREALQGDLWWAQKKLK